MNKMDEKFDAIRERLKSPSQVSKALHYNNDVTYLLEMLEEVTLQQTKDKQQDEELARLKTFSNEICKAVMRANLGIGPIAYG